MGQPVTPSGATGATKARIGSAFFLIGTIVTVLSIAFPHSAQADVDGFWALAVTTAFAGALLLGWGERMPAWGFQVAMAVGSALVALSIYFNGERIGGPAALNELLYLWIALYSGYFFTRAQILAQLSFMGLTYAVALVAIDPGQIGFTRWFIVIGMVSTAAFVVHTLRVRNDRLVEQLKRAARTDPLTGLLNRQGFDERFELELERSRRSGDPLVLALADFDRLKDLNDRLGHPAGDAALAEVGRILTESVRRIDATARVGGDEFALVLPGVGAGEGLNIAMRLRLRISEVTDRDGLPITMSFGIVEFPIHGATRETLFHAADRALYDAKRGGRDRSVVHPSVAAIPDS